MWVAELIRLSYNICWKYVGWLAGVLRLLTSCTTYYYYQPCQRQSSRRSGLAGRRRMADSRQPSHRRALPAPTSPRPCCIPATRHRSNTSNIVASSIPHGNNNIDATNRSSIFSDISSTVEPVLGDHPFCPAKAVSQDRWSLITGRTKILFYQCTCWQACH